MIAKFLVDLLGEEKGQGEMGEGRGRGKRTGRVYGGAGNGNATELLCDQW